MKKKNIFAVTVLLLLVVILLCSCNREVPYQKEVDYSVAWIWSNRLYTVQGERILLGNNYTVVGDKVYCLEEKTINRYEHSCFVEYDIETGAERIVFDMDHTVFRNAYFIYDEKYVLLLYSGYAKLVDIASSAVLGEESLFEYTGHLNDDSLYLIGDHPCYTEAGRLVYVRYQDGTIRKDVVEVPDEYYFYGVIYDNHYIFGTINEGTAITSYNIKPKAAYDVDTHETSDTVFQKYETERQKNEGRRYARLQRCHTVVNGQTTCCDCNVFSEKTSYQTHRALQLTSGMEKTVDETAETLESYLKGEKEESELFSAMQEMTCGNPFVASSSAKKSHVRAFFDVEEWDENVFAKELSFLPSLFDLPSKEEFLAKTEIIKKECREKIDASASVVNRCPIDGGVVAKNGIVFFPYAFDGSSIEVVLAITPESKCYIWIRGVDSLPEYSERNYKDIAGVCVLCCMGGETLFTYRGEEYFYHIESINEEKERNGRANATSHSRLLIWDGEKEITIDESVLATSPSYRENYYGWFYDVEIVGDKMFIVLQAPAPALWGTSYYFYYFDYDIETNTVRFAFVCREDFSNGEKRSGIYVFE